MANLYLELAKASSGYAVIARAYAFDSILEWSKEPLLECLKAKGYTLRWTRFSGHAYIVPIGYKAVDGIFGWRFEVPYLLSEDSQ